jgi:hypothetical protein
MKSLEKPRMAAELPSKVLEIGIKAERDLP